MNRNLTMEQYEKKVEAYKAVYDDDTVELAKKIELCEEFAYSDCVKGTGRIDFCIELIDMYEKAGEYQDVISFAMYEFKTRFENSDNHWMMIAGMCPFITFSVIDAFIVLNDFKMAKGTLDALKINRESMLNMHQNDNMRGECVYWYGRVITKYVEIAILEHNYDLASDYLLDDPIFEDYKPVEALYYMGLLSYGELDPSQKNTKVAVACFSGICDDDFTQHGYIESDKAKIIEANYYLGMIYAKEEGYKNKEKAIQSLNKAKELGYNITDDEIKSLTENIVDDTQIANNTEKKSGGCYVATAVYGSYDCPEVWTLRRFRDNQLAKTWHGRLFIHVYYAISPILVKWFGNTQWFKNMFKPKLDEMVEKLQSEGVENTPYDDIEW